MLEDITENIVCRKCKLYSSFADLGICQLCYNDYLVDVYGRDEEGNNTIDETKMSREEQMLLDAKVYMWNQFINRR